MIKGPAIRWPGERESSEHCFTAMVQVMIGDKGFAGPSEPDRVVVPCVPEDVAACRPERRRITIGNGLGRLY